MNEYIKKNLGLIMLLGIIVTMGLTYWFGIRSLNSVIGNKQENIQKSIAIRENRERQLGKLSEYESQYNRILEEEEKLGVFTEKEHMIDFIKQLEALAKEKGVKIVIEAREAPPVTKAPVKPAADAEKAAEAGGAEKVDTKKKDTSIIGNLPTQEYTRLALRVSGETKKVIEYLHLVETLPVALDVIALDAVRKERELQSVEAESSQNPAPAPETVTHEEAGLFVAVPEPAAPIREPEHFFELEVVADMIVYHHPNR